VAGRSGVWVRRPLSEDKVAAIGVRVQQGVTLHGFAINCNNTLSGFSGIIPCGITDAGVTTVSEVVGADVSPADIVDAVASAFAGEYVDAAMGVPACAPRTPGDAGSSAWRSAMPRPRSSESPSGSGRRPGWGPNTRRCIPS